MQAFVYPKLFSWDMIVPTDYPFIHMKGPTGSIGVLLVFESSEQYVAFCEGEVVSPLVIEQKPGTEVQRGWKQDGRNGQEESKSEVPSTGRRGNPGDDKREDVVDGRKRKRAGKNVGAKGSSRSGW